MPWGRRSRGGEPGESEYARRRRDLLALDAAPASAGAGEPGAVRRVVVETTYTSLLGDTGSLAIAASADGTAGALLTSGAVLSGSDRHPALDASVQALLRAAERDLARLPPAQPPAFSPLPGRVSICALTGDGAHAIELSEDELGHGGHALSGLFYAAHAVFADLRREWLADHDGRDVADDYGPPRWTEREVGAPPDAPPAPDAIFAELERDGVRQAVVSFSGGNDEGGADEITFLRGGGEPATNELMWTDGREDFAEALSAPIYDQIGTFAGAFIVHGTVTWDVPARSITLRDARSGEGEWDCDMNGEPIDPRED
jgi:hypothetical protein